MGARKISQDLADLKQYKGWKEYMTQFTLERGSQTREIIGELTGFAPELVTGPLAHPDYRNNTFSPRIIWDLKEISEGRPISVAALLFSYTTLMGPEGYLEIRTRNHEIMDRVLARESFASGLKIPREVPGCALEGVAR